MGLWCGRWVPNPKSGGTIQIETRYAKKFQTYGPEDNYHKRPHMQVGCYSRVLSIKPKWPKYKTPYKKPNSSLSNRFVTAFSQLLDEVSGGKKVEEPLGIQSLFRRVLFPS